MPRFHSPFWGGKVWEGKCLVPGLTTVYRNQLTVNKRDWPDSNRRPSASDWCEFPHSLDYSFTVGCRPLNVALNITLNADEPLGGGRYVREDLGLTPRTSL
ncbi:MAG: hypothetical protein ACFBSC_04630 [Microcoleaceae cyanobacterium]